MLLRLCPWLLILITLLALPAPAQSPPKREFRGVWVASVANLDWPTTPGASPSVQQGQLVTMLDQLKACGTNAVIFQIRPECDALYQSPFEPWSYYLTGAQGSPPSPLWDPLTFAVGEAHKRGMELHAWFNPYRAVRSVGLYAIDPNHVSVKHPDWILSFAAVSGAAALKILDPGRPEVRAWVAGVVADIVRRYDVDGIHADDYFYPYPPQQVSNEDAATFAAYNRGFANIGDWRRDNVNLLMKMIRDSIAAIKPYVKFGMSPFGIWKSGVPSGITGLDAYSSIYGDAMAWLHDGSIDYLTPQLYWKIGGGQDYSKLCPWWADSTAAYNRQLYPGQIFGSYTNAELPNQVRINRANPKVGGNILFRATQLVANSLGFYDTLRTSLNAYPSLAPVMAWKDQVAPYPVRAIRYAADPATRLATLTWQPPIVPAGQDSAARYAVYRFDHYPSGADLSDARNLAAVVGGASIVPGVPRTAAGPSWFAVTALDRNWNEGDTSNIIQIAPPPAPTPVAPPPGTTVPDSIALLWRSAGVVSQYDVQMSTDSTFAGGLAFRDSTLTDTSRMVRGLQGQLAYFWRVRAGNAAGWGPFAAGGKLLAGFPGTAVLLSPPDASPDIPIVSQLQWNPAASAASYRLQLAASADFSTLVLDSTGISLPRAVTPTLENYKIYHWRVRGVNAFGSGAWSAPFRFRTVQATGIGSREEPPKEFRLEQNYPNPFNPSTTISFALPSARHVTLTVYDVLGREIERLVDATLPAGLHSAVWNASHHASGMYVYRIQAGEYAAVGRMLLVK